MSWTPEHTDFIKFFMVKRAFFNIAHRVEWTKLCFALHLDLPEDCGPELTPEASFLLDQLMVSYVIPSFLFGTDNWLEQGFDHHQRVGQRRKAGEAYEAS